MYIFLLKVELDFRTLYPDVAENLFLKLTPALVQKMLEYANLQGSQWAQYLNVASGILKSGKLSNLFNKLITFDYVVTSHCIIVNILLSIVCQCSRSPNLPPLL